MKITRKLTLPGRREYESSTWEIEVTEADVPTKGKVLQEVLQIMCREAQARVLACAVADGLMTSDEMSTRLLGYLGETPEWLKTINDLKPQG